MTEKEKSLIEYLQDDIICMQNILRDERSISVRRECQMRIEANRREIERLRKKS